MTIKSNLLNTVWHQGLYSIPCNDFYGKSFYKWVDIHVGITLIHFTVHLKSVHYKINFMSIIFFLKLIYLSIEFWESEFNTNFIVDKYWTLGNSLFKLVFESVLLNSCFQSDPLFSTFAKLYVICLVLFIYANDPPNSAVGELSWLSSLISTLF